MTLWRNRHCENCDHLFIGDGLLNVGVCPKLGVISKRGEVILDNIETFEKLGTTKLEYRHPMVRRGFGCTYWIERKQK
jgi:hypothetical protein